MSVQAEPQARAPRPPSDELPPQGGAERTAPARARAPVSGLGGGEPPDLRLDDDEPRRELRLGFASIALFFGVFGGWAALAPLDAAVHAPGSVVVAQSRRAVQTQDGGTIAAIHVREGEQVEAGQVLVEMRAQEARSELQALQSQWIELTALRARLLAEETGQATLSPPAEWSGKLDESARAEAEGVLRRQAAELAARRRLLQSQQAVLGSRADQLNVQIDGMDGQRAAYERQQALLSDELAAVRILYEKGLAPATRLRALERAQADLDAEMAALQGSKARAREAIGETSLQRLSLADEVRVRRGEELRRTDQSLAEITPRLEAARARFDRSLIRAPANGAVVGLLGHTVGAVAPAGGRLMEIVPDDDELVIDAQVAPQHADDVKPGMEAEVRLPGLTGRIAPLLTGHVETISADRFVDERTGVPYFLVRVRIDEESLSDIARVHTLGASAIGPGLPAEVLITLRPRSALQYLIEPLDQAMWRSLRDY